MQNSKGVDILVTNEEAKKSLAIQVKTNQGSLKWWLLDKKAEHYQADNLFYIFVNLNNGQPHKDNPMCAFWDKELQYLNRWDLLDL